MAITQTIATLPAVLNDSATFYEDIAERNNSLVTTVLPSINAWALQANTTQEEINEKAAQVAAQAVDGGYNQNYINTNFVGVNNAQNITAVKTFTVSPIVPTPTTAAQVTNKDYVDNKPSGFKNYIINGKKVINQRVLTSTDNTYNQDRWYKSGVNWYQGIEGDNNLISGKTYTLSWVGAATASYYVGTETSATINAQSFTSITNGGNFTLTISIGQNLWIKFASDATGSTFNFVQLEDGSVATPFENRPYGLELSLCQRYLPFVTGFLSGYAATASEVYLPVPTSTIPFKTPTGTSFTLGGKVYYSNNESAITSIVFFAGSSGQNHTLKVKPTGTPLTVGHGVMVSLPNILFTGCEL